MPRSSLVSLILLLGALFGAPLGVAAQSTTISSSSTSSEQLPLPVITELGVIEGKLYFVEVQNSGLDVLAPASAAVVQVSCGSVTEALVPTSVRYQDEYAVLEISTAAEVILPCDFQLAVLRGEAVVAKVNLGELAALVNYSMFGEHWYANWPATPGAANKSPHTVLITEIYPTPNAGLGESEWVEVFNFGSAIIPLTGWQLADTKNKDALSGELLPQQYGIFPTQKVTLNNGGDTIQLINADNAAVDEAGYAAIKTGHSWQRQLANGTYGAGHTVCAPPTPQAASYCAPASSSSKSSSSKAAKKKSSSKSSSQPRSRTSFNVSASTSSVSSVSLPLPKLSQFAEQPAAPHVVPLRAGGVGLVVVGLLVALFPYLKPGAIKAVRWWMGRGG